MDADCWQEDATCVTMESIDSALDWTLGQPMTTEVTATSSTEAILKAMSDDHVSRILFSFHSFSKDARPVTHCMLLLYHILPKYCYMLFTFFTSY